MIDREHELPVTRQAKLLGLSRGSVYYVAQPVSTADLALMRRLDVDLTRFGRRCWAAVISL